MDEAVADYVPLDYKGRIFLIPVRFSEEVDRANLLAGRIAAIEYCCGERQREVNPATRPHWYEGYDETLTEYLPLIARLIPHAMPAVPQAC